MTDARRSDVVRVLTRYIIEIVEEYGLCPWARQARLGGAIAIDVLWGTPTSEQWLTSSSALLSRPEVQLALVVAPELACAPSQFCLVRDAVAARLPHAGIADFHPDAQLDLATPSRLVPYLRRAPDPMLQLVPLHVLESVRGRTIPAAERSAQAQMLVGVAPPPKPEPAAHIAANNYSRAIRDIEPSSRFDGNNDGTRGPRVIDAITAVLADIRADRDRTYALWKP